MFVQKAGDERGLYKNNRKNKCDLPLVLLPNARIAKINLASGGQAALANAPALHFPPVKHRVCKLHGWRADLARLLSAKDANGNGGCLSAGVGDQEKRATDYAMAEEGFVIRKNRRVSDGMKPCYWRIAFVYHARRVDDHQLPEDRRLLGKRGGMP